MKKALFILWDDQGLVGLQIAWDLMAGPVPGAVP